MGLKDRLTAALASKPEPITAPAATFFDSPAHEDTDESTKPAKTRKTRAKAIPDESKPVQAVDQREPLQTEVEHPRANLMRMMQTIESQQAHAQPTSIERTAAFRRPIMRNSLGLLSNGPINFSTHPNEYQDLYAQDIARERAEAKVIQENRAIRGLEILARMLTPAKRRNG